MSDRKTLKEELRNRIENRNRISSRVRYHVDNLNSNSVKDLRTTYNHERYIADPDSVSDTIVSEYFKEHRFTNKRRMSREDYEKWLAEKAFEFSFGSTYVHGNYKCKEESAEVYRATLEESFNTPYGDRIPFCIPKNANAVRMLNTYIRTVFGRFFAGIAGVSAAEYYDIPETEAGTPEVKF